MERAEAERKGIKMLSPKECLERLSLLNQADFVLKRYLDKEFEMAYLEILIDEKAKLVLKLAYAHWRLAFLGNEVEPRTLELFTSEAIVGQITMREIMQDARPDRAGNPALKEYFKQHPNSKYLKGDPLYPVGLAYGSILITGRAPERVSFHLYDVGTRFTGVYRLRKEDRYLWFSKVMS